MNDRTYAVDVLMGGLEGIRPPRSSSFGPRVAALPPHVAQKGNLGAAAPPPNPHRVNPVNEHLHNTGEHGSHNTSAQHTATLTSNEQQTLDHTAHAHHGGHAADEHTTIDHSAHRDPH